MLIYGHNGRIKAKNAVPNATLVKWIGERLGISDFGPCVTIGVVHDNEIVAVALYNKFLHPNIEVTFAISSPSWASPGAVRAILSYPFVQLDCKRITATVDSENRKAMAFLLRLGFRREGYHPDALPTGDAVTYGLLRKDAERWIENGKTAAPGPA